MPIHFVDAFINKTIGFFSIKKRNDYLLYLQMI